MEDKVCVTRAHHTVVNHGCSQRCKIRPSSVCPANSGFRNLVPSFQFARIPPRAHTVVASRKKCSRRKERKGGKQQDTKREKIAWGLGRKRPTPLLSFLLPSLFLRTGKYVMSFIFPLPPSCHPISSLLPLSASGVLLRERVSTKRKGKESVQPGDKQRHIKYEGIFNLGPLLLLSFTLLDYASQSSRGLLDL